MEKELGILEEMVGFQMTHFSNPESSRSPHSKAKSNIPIDSPSNMQRKRPAELPSTPTTVWEFCFRHEHDVARKEVPESRVSLREASFGTKRQATKKEGRRIVSSFLKFASSPFLDHIIAKKPSNCTAQTEGFLSPARQGAAAVTICSAGGSPALEVPLITQEYVSGSEHAGRDICLLHARFRSHTVKQFSGQTWPAGRRRYRSPGRRNYDSRGLPARVRGVSYGTLERESSCCMPVPIEKSLR